MSSRAAVPPEVLAAVEGAGTPLLRPIEPKPDLNQDRTRVAF